MKIAFPVEPSSPPSSTSAPYTQVTASLRKDHDTIKKVLKATETFTLMLKQGKELPPAILVDTVDFITNFIDRCHHTKEEKGLFASLVTAGLPSDSGPVAVMTREHEQARIIADRIKESAQRFIDTQKNDDGDRAKTEAKASLIRHCEEYIELMTMHLLKEDTRLFVIAEMQLRGKEGEVGNLIESLENDTLGLAIVESYRKKAESILTAAEQGLH
jgi:hemerythrin-like domain-containing protein